MGDAGAGVLLQGFWSGVRAGNAGYLASPLLAELRAIERLLELERSTAGGAPPSGLETVRVEGCVDLGAGGGGGGPTPPAALSYDDDASLPRFRAGSLCSSRGAIHIFMEGAENADGCGGGAGGPTPEPPAPAGAAPPAGSTRQDKGKAPMPPLPAPPPPPPPRAALAQWQEPPEGTSSADAAAALAALAATHLWFDAGGDDDDDSGFGDDRSVCSLAAAGGSPLRGASPPARSSSGAGAGCIGGNADGEDDLVPSARETSIASSGLGERAAGVARSLRCPICLDVLFRPLGLACGHVFCSDCAFTAVGRGNAVGTLAALLASLDAAEPCPECRRPAAYEGARQMVELSRLVRARHPDLWAERRAEALLKAKQLRAILERRAARVAAAVPGSATPFDLLAAKPYEDF